MQQKALQQRHSVCSVFLRYVLLFMFVPRGLLSHNLSTASALTKTNLPAVAKNSASVAACQLYYLGHTALQWENINVPIYFTVGIKPLQLHRTTTGGSGSQRWRCISIPEFVNVLNLAIKELFFSSSSTTTFKACSVKVSPNCSPPLHHNFQDPTAEIWGNFFWLRLKRIRIDVREFHFLGNQDRIWLLL